MNIQTKAMTVQTIGDSKVRTSVERAQDHEEHVPSVTIRTGRSLAKGFGSSRFGRLRLCTSC